MVMAADRNSFLFVTSRAVAMVLLVLLLSIACQAQLSPTFYDKTCANALTTIRTAIRTAIARERRMAASLIRLHFHDCFVQDLAYVICRFDLISCPRISNKCIDFNGMSWQLYQGCDASILLDDAPSITSEKNALQNKDSARGYEVIEKPKSDVEKICPGVVSCADILAVAARDASEYVGGPSWTAKLGRRDSTTASVSLAASELPRFTASLGSLIDLFGSKGLSARDMVALSGSHTIGQAQCVTFRNRIYNNASDIDAGFASTRRRRCPANLGNGDGNLAALDLVTPNSFDNNYFKNLMQKKGLLESDQVLFSGGSTDNIVSEYSRNPSSFKSDFANAMIKMGDIEPLTGSAGMIRKISSRVN